MIQTLALLLGAVILIALIDKNLAARVFECGAFYLLGSRGKGTGGLSK